ncbi:ISL3 family transposase (plasmid) [Embleya sp. NBC_00888]|uniref:ISL3 family transposase n=1 Tax=Embleya sp. NBC_00888 TaxID=2975960 RepID=UPI002F90FAAE|nr:ISL3 family transposase [Embleya sp. NBC_00888]
MSVGSSATRSLAGSGRSPNRWTGSPVRYGRRTPTEQRLLERVALALGGRAGERLTAHMAVPTSGSTLLRAIHRLDVPAPPKVEVLGVDEFSLRRGRVFGTILVDMESHRPVDVLPDHTADTFAAWLREHPEVRMVCRDRGGAFAEAVERALPGVPQVADRWHLLDNLATAVEKAVRKHRACLNPLPPEHGVPESAPDPGREESPAQQQILARWTEIRARYDLGLTIAAISEQIGLDRKTVRRYAHAATRDELITVRPRRGSALAPHMPYLAARWAEGCNNARTLRDEIAARGYTGSRKTVRRFLNSLADKDGSPMKPLPPPPVRDVARWIIGRAERQSEAARLQLKELCGRCVHLAEINRLARGFATLLRRRHGHRPPEWLAQADVSEIKELRTFAQGLRKDLDAVTAGLTLPWSSGAVEGHVNRTIMWNLICQGLRRCRRLPGRTPEVGGRRPRRPRPAGCRPLRYPPVREANVSPTR